MGAAPAGLVRETSLRSDAARARIQALWKQHPELTGKQVIASLGLADKHLLGVYRARQLLRECQLAAAKRSPLHQKAGWRLDSRTAARIRIGAICKRHPHYTAKQVLKALGPQHSVRARWVNQVMNECWQPLGRHGDRRCNGWTPERRKRQLELIRQFRPWEWATGPRTREGKARSAKNGARGATTRYGLARTSVDPAHPRPKRRT